MTGPTTAPHLALSADAHDRIGHRRTDEAWLDAAWSAPTSRVLVVSGTRVRPVDGALEWVAPTAAPDGVRVLLGERDDVVSWAVIADSALAREGGDWLPLRGLLPALAGGDFADAPLLLHAMGLAEWHWATRFCPRCGGSLEAAAGGHELRCTSCGKAQFPRTDPAVIMLVSSGEPGAADERCLLGRSPLWPAGRFSTLAGFCEPGESLEDAVRREVAEEVGVRVGEVTYFGNQPWPLPQSLMLGFVGRASSEEITVDADEIVDARWWTREELRAEAESGEIVLPGGVSISRSLIEHWYGGPLPGPGDEDAAADSSSVVEQAARVRDEPATRVSRPREPTNDVSNSAREGGDLLLDLLQRRVGLGGAVGVDEGRDGLVAVVGLLDDQGGVGLLLDVDHVVGDPLAVELAPEAVAVATPRGAVHREAAHLGVSPPASSLVPVA